MRVQERAGRRVAAGWVATGLIAAAIVQVVAFEATRRVFVDSVRGQWLDAAALTGNSIGRGHIEDLVDTVLNAMTVVSLAVATIAIVFIALLRGRIALAGAAILLIAGANVTTQLLKAGLYRPELGVDLERAGAGNSLPSGHTTVAASVAVALVFVVPPTLRPLAAVLGAGYTALAGVATLSAGWHRPSDAVAALLVVGAWAAVCGLLLMVFAQVDGADGRARAHGMTVGTLALAGLAGLIVAVIAMAFTYQALDTPPDLLSRRRLLTAYAGGAAGIAGTAGLVMAMVAASVPHVVRSRQA